MELEAWLKKGFASSKALKEIKSKKVTFLDEIVCFRFYFFILILYLSGY